MLGLRRAITRVYGLAMREFISTPTVLFRQSRWIEKMTANPAHALDGGIALQVPISHRWTAASDVQR